jgi:hypothetical protein
MAVNHVPVTSSAIESVGHDGTTLEVKFKSGKVYTCSGVTPEEHAKFMAQPSLGRAFNQMFRGRMALIEEPFVDE